MRTQNPLNMMLYTVWALKKSLSKLWVSTHKWLWMRRETFYHNSIRVWILLSPQVFISNWITKRYLLLSRPQSLHIQAQISDRTHTLFLKLKVITRYPILTWTIYCHKKTTLLIDYTMRQSATHQLQQTTRHSMEPLPNQDLQPQSTKIHRRICTQMPMHISIAM